MQDSILIIINWILHLISCYYLFVIYLLNFCFGHRFFFLHSILIFHSLLVVSKNQSSSKYLFQNQCFFHTLLLISSVGIPLVSGSKSTAKLPITTIQAVKKKNIPNCIWHSIVRKAWVRKFANSISLNKITYEINVKNLNEKEKQVDKKIDMTLKHYLRDFLKVEGNFHNFYFCFCNISLMVIINSYIIVWMATGRFGDGYKVPCT